MMNALALFGLSLVVSFPAFASSTDNDGSESKEDTRFEPQGIIPVDLRQLWEALEAAGKYIVETNDGTLQASYSTRLSGDEVSSGVDIALETRIIGIAGHSGVNNWDCYRDCYDRPGWLILPFETTVHVNLDSEGVGTDLYHLRAGVARVLFDHAGVNIQFLSYVLKQDPANVWKSHGFELANITFNELIAVNEKKTSGIVLKLSGTLGWSNSVTPISDGALGEVMEASGVNESTMGAGFFSPDVSAAGSVGIKIEEELLLDLFAGTQVRHLVHTEYYEEGGQDDYKSYYYDWGATVMNNWVGLGFRYRVTPALSVLGSVQFDQYTLSVRRADSQESGFKDISSGELNAVSLRAGAEVRW